MKIRFPLMVALALVLVGTLVLSNPQVALGQSSQVNSPNANAPYGVTAWLNPTNAYLDDGVWASGQSSPPASLAQEHQYYNYGFAIPAGSVILGIEVLVDDAYCDPSPPAPPVPPAPPHIDVELSWDNGVNWTAIGYGTGALGVGIANQNGYTLGGPTDRWGHGVWTVQQINQQFRVLVTGSVDSWVYMDWIPVTVYYTPPPSRCFIATATYDTPSAKEVELLRDFRDQYLLTNPVGEKLTSLYYKCSPPIADFIDEHPAMKPSLRVGLFPAVAVSNMAVSTSFTGGITFLSALTVISLIMAALLKRRSRKVIK